MSKILIIDDNPMLRKTTKEMLISRFPSVDILEAADAIEGFQKVENWGPDLIFMDIKLREENGLKLTKRIKAVFPKVIVIIFTNHDLLEYRTKAYECGAEHFLSKSSASTKDILKLVDSIISKAA
jgi:DNA-binding NarL/FixJ family response regulator